MTITAQPAPNAAPARLKIRKNIEALSAQELTDFRRAIKQAIALNDKRGFEYFAGWHGVPLGWCQHHDPLFLPWHRAYLYWLELALQSQVPGVTLPWWDWSATTAIPSAYASAQADGTENVLAKAPIKVFNTAPKPGWPTETSRAPGEIPQVPGPPYQQEWANAMKATNYMEFSQRIWTVHDTLHVWVGGASFVLHVFLNNAEADETTPRTAEQRYAGYLTVFAHGDCWGDIGHCDIPEPVSPFDQRPPHPLIPFNATLEISDSLSALPEGTSEITVTVLAFNKNGDEAGVLRFKDLTLLTYA